MNTPQCSLTKCVASGRYKISATTTMTTLISYLTLFLWSFLAATVVPIASEAALVAVVMQQERIIAPVAVATAGNYLGACTTYWLGYKTAALAKRRERRDSSRKQRRRRVVAMRLLRRYGALMLILSWVPLVGDVLVAAAGAVGVRFGVFTFWTILGKLLRYAGLAWSVGWLV